MRKMQLGRYGQYKSCGQHMDKFGCYAHLVARQPRAGGARPGLAVARPE